MDNLRRAILLITAVVFVVSAVFGFMTALDHFRSSETTVEELDYDGEKYSESSGETGSSDITEFVDNVLLVVGDEDTGSAEIISIMNYDSEKKSINFLYVPCDAKYSFKSEDSGTSVGVFKDCFKKHGGEQMTLILSAMLDISVGKYVYMDFAEYASFINHFSSRDSGVLFEMPVTVVGRHSNGTAINLQKGEERFDGNEAKQLAMYYAPSDGVFTKDLLEYYDGSQESRIRMVSSFTDAFINQKILKPEESYYSENFQTLLYSAKSGCETNITDEEFMCISETVNTFEKECTGFYMLVCKHTPGSINGSVYVHTVAELGSNDDSAFSTEATAKLFSDKFSTNND